MTSNYGVDKLRLKFPGVESLLFKDLSLSFRKGEKVLMLGPSGCGKSTLLQVLAGIIPNSIEVPMKANQVTIPTKWGYVFQDPDSQFCMPYADEEIAFVLENLQVPKEKMIERIAELLSLVGLQLDDFHTSIQQLSGGMKQRLAIASVLALEPDVLFLDEPTAMLDPEGTKQVWQTLKEVGQDKTVIIVEHKIDEVIDFVDRIVLFNSNGQIIADGNKDEVFQNFKQEFIDGGIWYPNVWEEYLNRRMKQSKFNRKMNEKLIKLENFQGFRGKNLKLSLDNVTIEQGEWIAITGENGAGKSTLLHALMQLIKTNGKYIFENQQVTKKTNLPEHMSFVFQNPEFQFVTNSVYDEIAFALRIDNTPEEEIKIIVEKLLQQFHLTALSTNHPFQLSTGQKRRLSVATALVKDKKVLLLDEPTFGQDAKNTFQILELLQKWNSRGTTVIMVTHDEHIASHFASRVWHISDGRLVNDTYNAAETERHTTARRSDERGEQYVR